MHPIVRRAAAIAALAALGACGQPEPAQDVVVVEPVTTEPVFAGKYD